MHHLVFASSRSSRHRFAGTSPATTSNTAKIPSERSFKSFQRSTLGKFSTEHGDSFHSLFSQANMLPSSQSNTLFLKVLLFPATCRVDVSCIEA